MTRLGTTARRVLRLVPDAGSGDTVSPLEVCAATGLPRATVHQTLCRAVRRGLARRVRMAAYQLVQALASATQVAPVRRSVVVPPPGMLTAKHVAFDVGVTTRAVYARARAEKMPAVRIGRTVYVPHEEVERWKLEREQLRGRDHHMRFIRGHQ